MRKESTKGNLCLSRVELRSTDTQASYAASAERRFAAAAAALSGIVCRSCGGPFKVVAYITDSLAIRQILDHLDLSPPEKAPPETRDVVRVPLDDEGREIELQPA